MWWRPPPRTSGSQRARSARTRVGSPHVPLGEGRDQVARVLVLRRATGEAVLALVVLRAHRSADEFEDDPVHLPGFRFHPSCGAAGSPTWPPAPCPTLPTWPTAHPVPQSPQRRLPHPDRPDRPTRLVSRTTSRVQPQYAEQSVRWKAPNPDQVCLREPLRARRGRVWRRRCFRPGPCGRTGLRVPAGAG